MGDDVALLVSYSNGDLNGLFKKLQFLKFWKYNLSYLNSVSKFCFDAKIYKWSLKISYGFIVLHA